MRVQTVNIIDVTNTLSVVGVEDYTPPHTILIHSGHYYRAINGLIV